MNAASDAAMSDVGVAHSKVQPRVPDNGRAAVGSTGRLVLFPDSATARPVRIGMIQLNTSSAFQPPYNCSAVTTGNIDLTHKIFPQATRIFDLGLPQSLVTDGSFCDVDDGCRCIASDVSEGLSAAASPCGTFLVVALFQGFQFLNRIPDLQKMQRSSLFTLSRIELKSAVTYAVHVHNAVKPVSCLEKKIRLTSESSSCDDGGFH